MSIKCHCSTRTTNWEWLSKKNKILYIFSIYHELCKHVCLLPCVTFCETSKTTNRNISTTLLSETKAETKLMYVYLFDVIIPGIRNKTSADISMHKSVFEKFSHIYIIYFFVMSDPNELPRLYDKMISDYWGYIGIHSSMLTRTQQFIRWGRRCNVASNKITLIWRKIALEIYKNLCVYACKKTRSPFKWTPFVLPKEKLKNNNNLNFCLTVGSITEVFFSDNQSKTMFFSAKDAIYDSDLMVIHRHKPHT